MVVDVASTLHPIVPHTVTITGTLFGGRPTCPLYHERQDAARCGLHVVNMLLGSPVYTHDKLLRIVCEWKEAGRLGAGRGVDASDLIGPSGDYSLDVLNTALYNELRSGPDMPLRSMTFSTVYQGIQDNAITSLVMHHDANDALMIPAHWLLLRKDDNGVWWNMDSMSSSPTPMSATDAVQQIRYYVNVRRAALFDASDITRQISGTPGTTPHPLPLHLPHPRIPGHQACRHLPLQPYNKEHPPPPSS